ncbi:H+/Cl- antiporter ClcA [Ensifer adhaerens]|nr:H+/Cl- antiporter ClcA [Ensifer adhaerens]HZG28984.1 chloride channel protein [Ensifer sp.]
MPNLRKLKLLRRIKVMRGRRNMWKSRVVFWAGALAIGLVSVAFAKVSDWASEAFNHVTHAGTYAFLIPLALTPAGFAFSAWLSFRYFPNSQGSGIPQAIAARHFHDAESRDFLLSLKLAAAKIVLTVFGIFCGGSIGREGPTVQVGASIMLQVARLGGVVQARGLILAGSAAGIAAAFNTPLAGIVFAIEEMSRNFEMRVNGAVVTAVILSGLAALGLLGDYNTYFGSTHDVMNGLHDWWLVLLCGIGGGAFGAFFSSGVLWLTIRLKRWRQAAPLPRLLMIAAGFGFLVAVIGIVSGGLTFGTGYNQARAALEGNPLPPLYFLEKLAATFLCTMSGIPGGLFAPSLAVGAGLGSTIGLVMGTNAGIAALLGMAGYFAGVVQAPMTAFVIILEMTDSHENVIALMATAMLGYITSRVINREPLYHGLSRAFMADTIRHQRNRDRGDGAASEKPAHA